MAMHDDVTKATDNGRSAKIGGFLAGAVGSIVLALMVTVAFNGQGIGDTSGPPPQIYTNF